MNPRLVVSLFASLAVGIAAGVAALVVGWGVLAALFVYSATGSSTLVLLCLAWPPAPRQPKVAEAKRRPASASGALA